MSTISEGGALLGMLRQVEDRIRAQLDSKEFPDDGALVRFLALLRDAFVGRDS